MKSPRRRGAKPEGGARQIRADDQPVAARQVQTHLAGSASDFDDPGVAGDRPIEQAGEGAPFRALAQPKQAVTRRIAGERRAIVERSDGFAAGVAGEVEAGDPVGCRERRRAGDA